MLRLALLALAPIVTIGAGSSTSAPPTPGSAPSSAHPGADVRDISTDTVASLLEQADKRLAEHQPTEARRFAERALAADPKAWRALVVIGAAEEQRGKAEPALAAFRKAAQLAPGESAPWQGVARVATDFEEARRAATKAFELSPEDAAAQTLKGDTQRRFEKYDEAIGSYYEALARHPENQKAAESLNSLLMSQGRADEALQTLMQLTKDRLDSPAAWRLLGEDCLSIGRYPEAEKVLRKAASLDSRNATVWSDLGAALVAVSNSENSVGRAAEAESAFRKALEIDPNNPTALVRLSLALLAQHRAAEAEDLCQKFVALNGRSAEGWLTLGKSRAVLGQYAKAIEAEETAIRLAPMETRCWKELQEFYQRIGKLTLGEEKLKQLLLEFPSSPPGWVSLGIILSAEGKNDAAIEAYAKAAALNDKNPDAWNGIGVAQAAMKNLDQAAAAFKKAVQDSPPYSEAWSNLGYIYFLQEKLPEAIGAYRRALQINPRNTLALSNLATAAAKSGDKDLANKTCDQLAEIDAPFAEKLRAQISK